MSNQIFLEIDNIEGLMDFLNGAKEAGFLKDISLDKARNLLEEKEFPIKIPIETDKLLSMKSNPITKMFEKKIDETAKRFLVMLIETG